MVEQLKLSQNGISSGKVLSERPEIAVLSPSLQILYMDRQAQILTSDFVPTTPEAQSNDRTHVLPPALTNLVGIILNALRSRHKMSEKGQIEIRCTVNETCKLVSICGIGVPNGHGVGMRASCFSSQEQAPTTQKVIRITDACIKGDAYQLASVVSGVSGVPACPGFSAI